MEKNLRHARDTKKRKEDADSVDDSNMSTSSNLEAFANDDLGIFLLLLFVISCVTSLLTGPSVTPRLCFWALISRSFVFARTFDHINSLICKLTLLWLWMLVHFNLTPCFFVTSLIPCVSFRSPRCGSNRKHSDSFRQSSGKDQRV